MKREISSRAILDESETSSSFEDGTAGLSIGLPAPAQTQLLRMFRDPYVLEKNERVELIRQLKEAVALQPEAAELRVLLGMALCVDFNGQTALEELRTAIKLNPGSFVARLKLGELLMRLRICGEAAEATHHAARLAGNALQAELARRQAAAIRTMQREGIERGGYGKLWSGLSRLIRKPARSEQSEVKAALNSH
jgi:cytochrome c-type biogenesis protein CcmH/NrfG